MPNHKGTIKRHKDVCLECGLDGTHWEMDPKSEHVTRFCEKCAESCLKKA
jgi:hypothetical protein